MRQKLFILFNLRPSLLLLRTLVALRLLARKDSVGVISLSTTLLSHGLSVRLRAAVSRRTDSEVNSNSKQNLKSLLKLKWKSAGHGLNVAKHWQARRLDKMIKTIIRTSKELSKGFHCITGLQWYHPRKRNCCYKCWSRHQVRYL